MLSLLSRQSANKNYSNPFRIRIFLLLSYSFGIETINTFIHSVVPSKTIPDSRPIWAKCIPVFRPKRRKTPPRRGGTYLYGLYKGVPPPPPPRGTILYSQSVVLQTASSLSFSSVLVRAMHASGSGEAARRAKRLSRLAPSVTRVAICVSRVLLDRLQKKERLLVVQLYWT